MAEVKLPDPVTVADFYLRAILDELRAQRRAVSSVINRADEDEERVKEPEPPRKKK